MVQTPDGAIRCAAVRIGVTEAEYRARVAAGEKWCSRCRACMRARSSLVTRRGTTGSLHPAGPDARVMREQRTRLGLVREVGVTRTFEMAIGGKRVRA